MPLDRRARTDRPRPWSLPTVALLAAFAGIGAACGTGVDDPDLDDTGVGARDAGVVVADGGGADAALVDGGSSDAGADDDGGANDAGLEDAGPRDAGGDAGPQDAATRDAGPHDAAPNDAGSHDAGSSIDAGSTRDAGPRDAGSSIDAGSTRDAGPADAGSTVDAGTMDAGSTSDAGPADAGPADAGSGPLATPTPPSYSGATCPTIVNGNNTGFLSGGNPRDFLVRLPANPSGAAVVFAWRWLTGTQTQAFDWTGITSGVGPGNVIQIAADTRPGTNDWQTGVAPASNEDLLLFDDILACLHDQFAVDMDRIWAHGHSSGALWVSYLIQHRAQYLAAASILSGGQQGAFTTPQSRIPTLLIWGGPTDNVNGVSFEDATLLLSSNLRSNGHFVVHCEGTFGHSIPASPEFTWTFLEDHPRGPYPDPYTSGLPSTIPSWCTIAP